MSQIQSMDDVHRVIAEHDRLHPPENWYDRRERELREAKRHEPAPATNGADWESRTDARIDARMEAIMQRGGVLCDAIGGALAHDRQLPRAELQKEIAALRSEVVAADEKLRDKLRDALDRLAVVDQDRRECERALSQTNLDARDARIAGAIEAVTVKLRSEFDVAGDKLRDEFNAATSKFHERLARLPLVKAWQPDAVHYTGDVATHGGSVYQARKDTGKEPGHPDWILLARAGRDGCDGRTPTFRGAFDAHEAYARLDVVEYDGSSFVALRDDPGIPGDDGWQLLSRPGSRGPVGDVGPRGLKGERGARGADAPTIVSWSLDRKNYRAIPTMSDGRAGAPLELRGLFEQYLLETSAAATD